MAIAEPLRGSSAERPGSCRELRRDVPDHELAVVVVVISSGWRALKPLERARVGRKRLETQGRGCLRHRNRGLQPGCPSIERTDKLLARRVARDEGAVQAGVPISFIGVLERLSVVLGCVALASVRATARRPGGRSHALRSVCG